MYRAKHSKSKNNRFFILFAALVLLTAITVGTTSAFVQTDTEPKVNHFQPSKVACDVVETFDGKIKSNVSLKNTGDTTAYLRAAVVVIWKKTDGSGEVAAQKPLEQTDYTIAFADDTGWVHGNDGYWYYTAPVAPKGSTGLLIRECKPLTKKDGYALSVEIVASALQSMPADAVKEAWGVTVDTDGTIQKGA